MAQEKKVNAGTRGVLVAVGDLAAACWLGRSTISSTSFATVALTNETGLNYSRLFEIGVGALQVLSILLQSTFATD